jgi:hypothetical protein
VGWGAALIVAKFLEWDVSALSQTNDMRADAYTRTRQQHLISSLAPFRVK